MIPCRFCSVDCEANDDPEHDPGCKAYGKNVDVYTKPVMGATPTQDAYVRVAMLGALELGRRDCTFREIQAFKNTRT